MPEIILVGFTDVIATALVDKIFLILIPVVADPKNIICTTIKAEVKNAEGEMAPYIIVKSTPNDLEVVTGRLSILEVEIRKE